MNLVSFSIRTKGVGNFARRLWTVFTRFSFSEAPTRRALEMMIETLQCYNAVPTFFIPAVVLRRHPTLIAEIARDGTEIGMHGYVHNDYRFLSGDEQYKQTKQAITVFEGMQIPFHGFRNPYLGWTEESLHVFAALGFTYESNEAVIHDVIDLGRFSPQLREGYEKSLTLFQAIPCNAYSLRPHFEGALLRIPTSIPDDEMLFDRLRITDPREVGSIWRKVMQRVYDLGGLYTLNLHPERAVPCKQALDMLLSFACTRPLPIWMASLKDIAVWWRERSQFRLIITPQATDHWKVEAICTPRATLLARHLTIEDQAAMPWADTNMCVQSRCFIVNSIQCPCIGVSPHTPKEVIGFLYEQGYPVVLCTEREAHTYALYLDLIQGFGATLEEQARRKIELVRQIEEMAAPLLYFGCWPNGSIAALAISGDIDSVTVQDFFLRILEVRQQTP